MSDRPGTLAEALIQLQARLPRITRDATGQIQSREYKYAKLDQLFDAVFPLLEPLGLFWTCCPTLDLVDRRFVLSYMLMHTSGEQIKGQFPLPENVSSQAQGSAITYAERYAFMAVIGIAPADDDGAAATAEWRPPADPRTRKATRHRMTAGEVTDWAAQSETLPDDEVPGTVTDDQLAEIRTLFTSLGYGTDDQAALVMSALNFPQFRKFRDLSRGQGENLIGYLRALETSTEGGA
jgi:hypothetical protein